MIIVDHSYIYSWLIESELCLDLPCLDISSNFSGCFNLMCCSKLP